MRAIRTAVVFIAAAAGGCIVPAVDEALMEEYLEGSADEELDLTFSHVDVQFLRDEGRWTFEYLHTQRSSEAGGFAVVTAIALDGSADGLPQDAPIDLTAAARDPQLSRDVSGRGFSSAVTSAELTFMHAPTCEQVDCIGGTEASGTFTIEFEDGTDIRGGFYRQPLLEIIEDR